jgi:hypothetical protein
MLWSMRNGEPIISSNWSTENDLCRHKTGNFIPLILIQFWESWQLHRIEFVIVQLEDIFFGGFEIELLGEVGSGINRDKRKGNWTNR